MKVDLSSQEIECLLSALLHRRDNLAFLKDQASSKEARDILEEGIGENDCLQRKLLSFYAGEKGSMDNEKGSLH